VTAEDGTVAGLVDFSSISGWTLVALLGVSVGTWLAERYVKRWVLRGLERVDGLSAELRATSARVVGYFILLIGAGLGLTVLGAQIQPLLAAAVIVAAVIVLALRGVADNFGASIVLQTRKPVRHGDWVDVDGVRGSVIEMNARSVVLTTADGRQVHVPNAALLAEPIINLTVGGGIRTEIELRTEIGRARHEASDLAVQACASVPGVLSSPSPDVIWTVSTPTSATCLVRFWTEASQEPRVRSAVLDTVAETMAAHDIAAWLSASISERTVSVVTSP
jgi:small conductance mechanosensitive channel